VVLSYVDQSRDSLIGNRSVWEEISDGGKDLVLVGKREVNSRAYAASFGFRGPDQQKKVKDLSGGERNRLHLATLLKSGGNLLLLDEPTNDLDVPIELVLHVAVREQRHRQDQHAGHQHRQSRPSIRGPPAPSHRTPPGRRRRDRASDASPRRQCRRVACTRREIRAWNGSHLDRH